MMRYRAGLGKRRNAGHGRAGESALYLWTPWREAADSPLTHPRVRHTDSMVTVPAIVWRRGPVSRGLMVGLGVGLFFGTLAWLDSAMLLSGAIVCVVLGVGSAVWIPRRMTKYWPGSTALSGDQRATVVSAVRAGTDIGDPALTQPVIGYSRGLHAAAENTGRWRWLVIFVLVVAAGMALWDGVFGSWGNAIASVVYLVLAGLELFWWPNRLTRLLANANRAASLACPLEAPE